RRGSWKRRDMASGGSPGRWRWTRMCRPATLWESRVRGPRSRRCPQRLHLKSFMLCAQLGQRRVLGCVVEGVGVALVWKVRELPGDGAVKSFVLGHDFAIV